MTRLALVVLSASMIILPALLALSASADKCGIPLDRNVEFNESAQNAIAAWNGEKECLLLSTDLQSAQPGRLMEMLPLPSAPYDIKAGNQSSFTTLIKLYNEKMRRLDISPGSGNDKATGLGGEGVGEFRGIEVVFSSSVGLHNLTVVKVESTDHFLQWTRSFAGAQGVSNFSINERLNQSVAGHLQRGISYFVFDVVEVTAERRTAEPLAYFFNTSYLYYPLRITFDSLPEAYRSQNEISVFLVADGVVRREDSYAPGLHFTGGVSEYIEFTPSELRKVSAPLGALFSKNAFVAHLSGNMRSSAYWGEEVKDVVLNASDFRRPTADELRAQYERADFLRSIKPLSPSLAYYLLRGLRDPGYAPPAFWLALIMMGIFIGPVAIGLMFKSIMQRGDRRSAIWIAWLVLYLVGITAILGFSFLASVFSGFETDFLPVFLALLLPLVIVLYLGERYRSRPAAGKHTVGTIAFGMAAAQVAVMVFTPNATVSFPLGALCFPVIGIASIVVIAIALTARNMPRHQAVWIPPPPPAT